MSRMPALFVGHGSPMNAIEKNAFSDVWIALGEGLPKPEAILSISAHWFTRGTRINNAQAPRMIYDMYGFPDALYRVIYPAPGSPRFARRAVKLLKGRAKIDSAWGLDHGTWSVLRRIFPNADVPVFQLSVDALAAPKEHYSIGEALRSLRDEGVLIFGSGNVVHNLALVDWDHSGGFDWARAFDESIKQSVLTHRFENAVAYSGAGESARLAVPTLDHFAPLLTVLGASDGSDTIQVFNEACVFGSLSMTGYLFDNGGKAHLVTERK